MKRLLLILIIGMFMISFASALDFDNGIKYEKNDLKVTFENRYLFGIGEWLGFNTSLGSAELKSHKNINEIKQFGYGKEEVVMWYDFEGWELYKNGLGEVEITNLISGELIERDYHFVEWAYAPTTHAIYDNVEVGKTENGTSIYERKKIGTGEYLEWQWINYTGKDIPNRNTRIGLKTYIERGDKLDAKWFIAGKKVSKHAGWVASNNVDLLFYVKFGEGTGTTAVDSTGNGISFTGGNTPGWTTSGQIGNATNLELDNNEYWENTTALDDLGATDELTVSLWINGESWTNLNQPIHKYLGVSGETSLRL